MNTQSVVDIKAMICMRPQWVPDCQAKRCHCCSKEFIIIVRNKHHCRFCGNVVCAGCSSQSISGEQISYSEEKKLRICDGCYEKVKKMLKKSLMKSVIQNIVDGAQSVKVGALIQKVPNQPRKQQNTVKQDSKQLCRNYNDLIDNSDQSEDEQDSVCFQQPKQIEQQALCRNELIDQSKQIISATAKFMCEKYNVNTSIWVDKLVQLAIKSIYESKKHLRNWQPNHQIAIRTIETDPGCLTSVVVRGAVFQNHIPARNQPTHFKQPRVLVIKGSLNIDAVLGKQSIAFEQILRNQRSIMKTVLQKLMQLNPNVIFVEQAINIFAQQYLQQREVLVVSRCKQRQIEQIMQVAKIKRAIGKLWRLDQYNLNSIVGHCDRIYFKTVRAGQMLLFLEAEVGLRSIVVGDHSGQLVSKLKRILDDLLMITWQLRLASQFQLCNKILQLPCANMLQYSRLDWCQSTAIFSMSQAVYCLRLAHQVPKQYAEYAHRIGQTKFFDVCGELECGNESLLKSGKSLGEWLMRIVYESQKKCKKCENAHAYRFYLWGCCVTVMVEQTTIRKRSKVIDNDQQDEDYQNQKRIANKIKNYFLNIGNIILTLSSDNPSISQKTTQTIQTIQNTLSTQSTLCLQPIKMTRSTQIGKNYLSANLFYYLYWLTKAGLSRSLHSLSLGTSMIMFQMQPQLKSEISYIELKNTQTGQLLLRNQTEWMQQLTKAELKQKKCCWDGLQQRLKQFSFEGFRLNTLPTRTAILYDQSSRVVDIVRCLGQSICERDMQRPIEEQTKDWTIFMRMMHKIESVIKLVDETITQLSQLSKKEKIISSSLEDTKIRPSKTYRKASLVDNNQSEAEQIRSKNMTVCKQQATITENLQEFNDTDSQVSPPATMINFTSLEMSLRNSPTRSESFQTMIVEPAPKLDRKKLQSSQKLSESQSDLSILFRKLKKQRFMRYQGVYLYFPIANIDDPVSILACCLNTEEMKQSLESAPANAEIRLRLEFNKQLKTDWHLREEAEQLHKKLCEADTEQKQDIFEVVAYLPREFEQLRVRVGIDMSLFVCSLCGCQNWDSSGGKSCCTFAKSHNQLLVVKIINDKEFFQFQKFAGNYLKYIKERPLQSSFLAHVYGIYQIGIKGKVSRLIVMQNVFFGMNAVKQVQMESKEEIFSIKEQNLEAQPVMRVYDLKGSQVNRLAGKGSTGLDTDFLIEKAGKPYLLSSKAYKQLMKGFQDDANFLKDQSVIDYSLLAIEKGDVLRLAIIDFMRPYHLLEKLQTLYKEIKNGRDPTVIPPQAYAERFMKAMRKYFGSMD